MQFKFKNWLLVLILGALFLVGANFFFSKKTDFKSDNFDLDGVADRSVVKLKTSDQEMWVEVVNSNQSITQGLSGRERIGGDNDQVSGMLFVFDKSRQVAFWMKDMKFDLDLVWIKNNQVVDVTEQVPAPGPGIVDVNLPIYQPNQLVDMVLEVEAGQAQELGLVVGTNLEFSKD